YVVFRPKMILDWDTGEGKDWQPMLWRELQRAAPSRHQAALGSQLIDALKRNRAPVPERVSIFGVSTLPPFYISLIAEISARGRGFARSPARSLSGGFCAEAERHHRDDAGRVCLCALHRCSVWRAGEPEAENSVLDC